MPGTAGTLEALRTQKAEVIGVAALVAQYRRVLRRGFVLAADGPSPSAGQCADFLGDEARLAACLGYELSAIVPSIEADTWRRETGLNAFRGEPAGDA